MSRCLGLVLCLCVIAMLVGGASAAQEPSPDIALLQAGAPDVLYQPSGSPGSVVPTGDTQDVRAGDGIAVSVGGWASLQFRDSLYVQIFHDSELRIESSLQPDPDAPLIYYFSMLAGTIFGERDTASIAQRRVIISTPNGVTIQPTGTRFLVYFEPATQTCWVVVKEGQVRVSAAGFDLDVPAGFQTWVEGDQAPQPPAPSGRAAIRTRFPSIDDLTGDMLAEADLLPEASGPDSPVGDAPGPATIAPTPLPPTGEAAPLPAAPAPGADAQLCSPETADSAEAPFSAIMPGQPLVLPWRLCNMWRAVERLDFHPVRFVSIRTAFLQGYPASPTSPELSGPGPDATEVTIARMEAFSGGYEQRFEIELQIQYDGDFIDFRNSNVLEELQPDFPHPEPVTFSAAFADATARRMLPAESGTNEPPALDAEEVLPGPEVPVVADFKFVTRPAARAPPVMEAVSGAPKPVAKGPPVVQPPPPVEPAAAAPVAAPVVAQPVAAAPLPAAPSAAHAAPQPNHVGKQEANPSNTGDKTGKANKGDRGDKGEKGEKGDKGDKGHRGEEGNRDDDSD